MSNKIYFPFAIAKQLSMINAVDRKYMFLIDKTSCIKGINRSLFDFPTKIILASNLFRAIAFELVQLIKNK